MARKADRWDYQTPIEETMEAQHDVVRAGKARYTGRAAGRGNRGKDIGTAGVTLQQYADVITHYDLV